MTIALAHAKKYLANGWSVFPIPHGKKEPVIKWGEYRERHATTEEVEAWFSEKESNVGIVTGKLSNLTVLDADGTSGIKELDSMRLVSTASVLTGGGGKQLFFQHSGETNKWTSKDHEGLDSRGEGGYVVAPPSLHPSGMKYRWATGVIPQASHLPAWPTGLLETPKVVTVGQVVHNEPWLVQALKGAGSGGRHKTLVRLACYLIPRHPYDVVKHMLVEWNSKNTPPLADDEVVKQLNDLVGRFKKGQYTSKYTPPMEPSNEPLDIRSPNADADAYINAQINRSTNALPELSTGYPSLDGTTWGLKRGVLYTIGARPGTGKTSLLVNISSNLCKTGKRVLFFSTEMSYNELFDKFLASEAEIEAFNIESGQLNADEQTKRAGFIPKFKAYDLHIVNLFKPDQVSVRKAVEQIQPDVLVFDHIQHIAGGESEYHEISNFTKFLKQVAMESNICVLVASQLNRTVVFEGIMPELHHLKGCGTLEEESSVVLLMHDDSHKGDRPILIRVAKNRHGKCGDTTLLFKASITKFIEMDVKVS